MLYSVAIPGQKKAETWKIPPLTCLTDNEGGTTNLVKVNNYIPIIKGWHFPFSALLKVPVFLFLARKSACHMFTAAT